ncbi:Piso0_000326 [Millerozyma farinosa CBS 7064]|uniref:E3 ubiquitin-protein ligase PEP5 n=1 Tax=Pichia sorbitophila (strain ATCC MYA-4447 / BCRC 22081 / CBS 7064 / NBRC 10061 / NRRL Y-12695) TaxID=559304 RepID=G8YTP2_PICSO|nr:Piso0_000326 [Millerozyma farinosa CBS 7064]CCE73293.1 Piso0_000326 [Millerozyma farinosa CBS 7064]
MMESLRSWRQIQSFEVIPIRDPNMGTDKPLFSDSALSDICCTKSYIVLSLLNSMIKIISKDYEIKRQFFAYDEGYQISFMKAMEGSNFVVTLAEKQGSPPILRLWDLYRILTLPEDVITSREVQHKYVTQVVIHNENNAYPISAFTFNSNLTCTCVGYTSGKVILVRGDLIRDRGSKQRVIYEAGDPITNIQFSDTEEFMYLTTTSKIFTFSTTGRNQGRPLQTLSTNKGVDLNCSDIAKDSQQLVVADKDEIRFYTPIGKSHTFKFPSTKKFVFKHSGSYLLVVSQDPKTSNDRYFHNSSRESVFRIMVLDLKNRVVCMDFTDTEASITHVFSMMGDLSALNSNGVLYKFREVPINQQIQGLIQRKLYSLALALAQQNNLPNETIREIYVKSGDNYYSEQRYNEAIDDYIEGLNYFDSNNSIRTNDSNKTNGNAYQMDSDNMDEFILTVIAKFKDAFNMSNLTRFLKQLYKMNLADNEHLTLLLCCYCKLKMTADINEFVENFNFFTVDNSRTEPQELNFRLIINLYKECGYYQELLKLLFKLNQPGLIVEIFLNDTKESGKCLRYIKSLQIDDLLLILIEHSKKLLDELPYETTDLLINVFTGLYKPSQIDDIGITEVPSEQAHEISENERFRPLNSYKTFMDFMSNANSKRDATETITKSMEPTYSPPKPSLIFPSFINHPKEFVIFLEACIESFDKYQGQQVDKRELLMTLLEMYIVLSQEEKESSKEWLLKAEDLVHSYRDFLETSSLLLLSHIYDFKEGQTIAEEQAGLEEVSFRQSQISGDVKSCIEFVKKYGETKPELYLELLKFVVSEETIFNRVQRDDFNFILNNIKTRSIATPLEVIQILGSTKFATLELIEDYLVECIEVQDKELSNNIQLIQSYEKDSAKSSHQITEMQSKAFVIQNNKCSRCQKRLEFPVVHFKCKHSFHQHCLNETLTVSSTFDLEHETTAKVTCPVCKEKHAQVHSIRADQTKMKDDLELLEQTLDESPDRMKVLIDYLGKGVMENDSVTLLGAQ